MSLEKHCRLCANPVENSEVIEIFGHKGIGLNAHSIITSHFSIHITINDEYSTIICTNCWWKINDFHTYYLMVQQAQQLIVQSKVEPSDNDDNDSLTSNHEYNNYSKIEIKTEKNIEIIDNEDQFNDYNQPEELKLFCNVKTDHGDDEEDDKFVSHDDNYERNTNNEDDKLDEDDEQILLWCNLTCEFCSKIFRKFSDIKSHYQKEHNMNGFVRCCSKKYYRRIHLLDHVFKHKNPNAFRCDICDKTFDGKKSITSHMQKHIPIDQRKFKCEICSNRFSLKCQLNLHLKLRHSTENNVCDQCGKAYASKATLRTHVKYVHVSSGYVCDICAKVFRRRENFAEHMLKHSVEKQPKVKCEICDLWLKTRATLRSHRRRAHSANSTQTVHKCNICGQIAPNDLALKSHKRRVHFTEKTHKCSICDKTFKVAIVLKEHMAIHTGEYLYTCTFCPKKFNSSSNMFTHRKKIHREQWEAEILKKQAGY